MSWHNVQQNSKGQPIIIVQNTPIFQLLTITANDISHYAQAQQFRQNIFKFYFLTEANWFLILSASMPKRTFGLIWRGVPQQAERL